jgi:4-hydroxybenzoyl-CoA reductase subunit beta
VTLARLCTDPTVRAELPALAAAAATVAAPAHRSVATLGGNLCLDTRCVFYNQSGWWRRANAYCLKHRGDTCHVAPQGRHCHAAYSGDLAPVLLAAEAYVEIAGPQGPRTIGLDALYVEDGAAHLALGPGEILVRVLVPPQPAGARLGYRKARVRAAIDFPLAGVAARVGIAGDRVAGLRIALTGTNARPFLLAGTDACLGRPLDDVLVELGRLVGKQVSPMRTTAMSGHYRRQVAAVLARRLVAELAGAVSR